MEIVIVLAVVLVIAIMMIVSQRQSVTKMKDALREAQNKSLQLEQKIDASRDELKRNREELERGKNALKDARELSKKKMRRFKDQENETFEKEAPMTISNNDDSLAISALEAQIEQMKGETNKNQETLRAALEDEFKKKLDLSREDIEGYKKKISELQEELKKQKRLLRPEGNKIDLKALPDEAAGEFARVYRKAEQHERLHGIARAKLQLAQEKFADLQKRYFSVCRELAVAVGKKEDISPVEAREVAEAMVSEHHTPHEQNKA